MGFPPNDIVFIYYTIESRFFLTVLRIIFSRVRKIEIKGGKIMRKEETEAPNWEVKDPKVPVVKSGHMENRARNEKL